MKENAEKGRDLDWREPPLGLDLVLNRWKNQAPGGLLERQREESRERKKEERERTGLFVEKEREKGLAVNEGCGNVSLLK